MTKNKNRKTIKITPSQSQSATINDLPDHILCHILSFLPIKEAFKTSILSKRWLPLCYSLSVLHFDFQTNNWIPLRRFIDKVMFSPFAQHVTLKSFHVICCSIIFDDDDKEDSLAFHNWVEEAKRRSLEELHILFESRIRLKPATFFCSKTLVVLNLTNSVVLTMLHCSVDLPSLKTLDLTCVKFQNIDDFMKLLSGCPILENLKTFFIKATNSGVKLGGYYKPLSKLIKANIQLFQVPLRAVYNVKFLTIWQMEKSLSNKEISSYYKDFPVFENLTELELELSWSGSRRRRHHIHDWNEVVKMLQNCPKLQTLSISKAKNLKTREDWKYSDHVPERVLSHLTTCVIFYHHAVEADFRFATYILQNAKFLQGMHIYYSKSPNLIESPQFLEDFSSCPRISPVCMLSLNILGS